MMHEVKLHMHQRHTKNKLIPLNKKIDFLALEIEQDIETTLPGAFAFASVSPWRRRRRREEAIRAASLFPSIKKVSILYWSKKISSYYLHKH